MRKACCCHGSPHLLLRFESDGRQRHRREASSQFAGRMSDKNNDQSLIRAQRRDALVARRGMHAGDRRLASHKIADFLTRTAYFSRSRFIACYLPAYDEVDTWSIISRAWRMKKRVFAPVIAQHGKMQFREVSANSDLVHNFYGIHEPVTGAVISAKRLDIVLAPLVAFDSAHHRIGMGGGYYDRAFSFAGLRDAYHKPKIIGLAFDCQKVDEISPNPWDIRVFHVITESGAN